MAIKEPVVGRRIEGTLESGGFPMRTDPDRLGWLKPTDPNQPMDVLRQEYLREGYVWLKGILDRQKVLDFRARYFERLRETGLLKEGSDPELGLYSGGDVDQEAVREIKKEIVRWAAYEAFCLAEPILDFYEAFFGGPTYLHKRKIIRHMLPGSPTCTGAHYDLVYLRGGTDNLCSSWIPIGDTPVEMGGLVYLEGSDEAGRKMEAEFAKKRANLPPEERVKAFNVYMNSGWLGKDLNAIADRLGGRWLVADYEAGDMVVHSPYIVHASTRNIDPQGRIRLSTDIRYQCVWDDIDVRWNNHWDPEDGL